LRVEIRCQLCHRQASRLWIPLRATQKSVAHRLRNASALDEEAQPFHDDNLLQDDGGHSWHYRGRNGPCWYQTARLLIVPDPANVDRLSLWQQFRAICPALLATAAHAGQIEANAG
jgi:hypothetical protein